MSWSQSLPQQVYFFRSAELQSMRRSTSMGTPQSMGSHTACEIPQGKRGPYKAWVPHTANRKQTPRQDEIKQQNNHDFEGKVNQAIIWQSPHSMRNLTKDGQLPQSRPATYQGRMRSSRSTTTTPTATSTRRSYRILTEPWKPGGGGGLGTGTAPGSRW